MATDNQNSQKLGLGFPGLEQMLITAQGSPPQLIRIAKALERIADAMEKRGGVALLDEEGKVEDYVSLATARAVLRK